MKVQSDEYSISTQMESLSIVLYNVDIFVVASVYKLNTYLIDCQVERRME